MATFQANAPEWFVTICLYVYIYYGDPQKRTFDSVIVIMQENDTFTF